MLRVWSTLEIPCPYPLFERIKLELAAMGGILTDTEYGAEILLHVIVPQSDAEALLARIVDVSNGRMAGRITGAEYRAALQYMENLGIVDGYCQDSSSAKEEYTPPFDLTGV